MIAQEFTSFDEVLSPERFAPYLNHCNGNRERAVALYTHNTQLAESLYPALHMLEIALRNRINTIMQAAYGANWF